MYNTRRGGTPSSNVGQRRQPAQNQTNFVPGGQLRPTLQPLIQKPVNSTGAVQAPPPKIVGKPTIQNKQNVRTAVPASTNTQKSATVSTQQAAPVITPQVAPVITQQTAVAITPPIKTEPQMVPAPVIISTESPMDHDGKSLDQDGKVKPTWMKKGKISKTERNKKRNERLRKILQPKNALMVLNEIVGQTNYELVDIPASERFLNNVGPVTFKAVVLVDEKEHEGYGRSKPVAKNAAAEAALKHLVLTRFKTPMTENSMETDEIETKEIEGKDDVSYSHLASYALYKLFNSWEDALPLLNRSHNNSTSSLNLSIASIGEEKPPLRPSKKLPDSPEKMNPVMLLNQMHPDAVYEEICQTGNPPNIVFTMKCIIGDRSFVGNGSSKKVARREAAFQACREVLQVKYDE